MKNQIYDLRDKNAKMGENVLIKKMKFQIWVEFGLDCTYIMQAWTYDFFKRQAKME